MIIIWNLKNGGTIKSYIKYIEKATDCHIKYVSVGAGRDEYFEM